MPWRQPFPAEPECVVGDKHDRRNQTDKDNLDSRIWAQSKGCLSVVFSSRTATAGLVIVSIWVFLALLAPLVTSYSPLEQIICTSTKGHPRHIFSNDTSACRIGEGGLRCADDPVAGTSQHVR